MLRLIRNTTRVQQQFFSSSSIFGVKNTQWESSSPVQIKISSRSYCEPTEEDDGLPEGEEWAMLRQAKKTTKKRLEAKRKHARSMRPLLWQAWTHMYQPEHAKEILKSLKEQSKYDDVVLTPKHGERYFRVWRARQIREQNQARSLKVFPGGKR